ncbi:MarR family winged helix-turn-helix transcriptional regulator [Actinomadura parmotrematis]|uniref:MarR family winged helix-turn-helix transcriptional regulator n=1 Tax=Actinomadura parmotrematis TaxID=2864039 RepID=UPI0027E2D8FB|nr:MarR family transcriptional regulator [Actinomadura parmotrematis]
MTETDRELAEQLNRRLRDVVLLLRRLTADQAITSQQASVLGSLEHGPARMSDLAAEHGVRLPTMTAQINRLERDGLVERGRDGSDARVVTVEITPAGRAQLVSTRDRRIAVLSGRIAALEPDQRAALIAALPALERLFASP